MPVFFSSARSVPLLSTKAMLVGKSRSSATSCALRAGSESVGRLSSGKVSADTGLALPQAQTRSSQKERQVRVPRRPLHRMQLSLLRQVSRRRTLHCGVSQFHRTKGRKLTCLQYGQRPALARMYRPNRGQIGMFEKGYCSTAGSISFFKSWHITSYAFRYEIPFSVMTHLPDSSLISPLSSSSRW